MVVKIRPVYAALVPRFPRIRFGLFLVGLLAIVVFLTVIGGFFQITGSDSGSGNEKLVTVTAFVLETPELDQLGL